MTVETLEPVYCPECKTSRRATKKETKCPDCGGPLVHPQSGPDLPWHLQEIAARQERF